jgi:hypothetical protein
MQTDGFSSAHAHLQPFPHLVLPFGDIGGAEGGGAAVSDADRREGERLMRVAQMQAAEHAAAGGFAARLSFAPPPPAPAAQLQSTHASLAHLWGPDAATSTGGSVQWGVGRS